MSRSSQVRFDLSAGVMEQEKGKVCRAMIGGAESVDAGMVLRQYQPSDLEAMTQLDAECFSEDFVFGLPLMRVLAEKAHALTLMMETGDGAIAGFAIAHRMQESAPEAAYLVTLDVSPVVRRRGVGHRLLAAIEDAMLEASALRLDLHVYTENTAAIAFYERQGYRRRARVPNFYGVLRRDAYLYSRELQPTPIA